MPGLIQQPPPTTVPAARPGAGVGKPLSNPVLEKVKQDVESKLPEALRDGYQRIVGAGLKVLYDARTRPAVKQVMDRIAQSGNDPKKIATGIINLLGMIYQQSKGQMPVQAAFPAGVVLMAYVLDDLAQTRGLQVTPDLVKQIGALMKPMFQQAFGLGGTPPANQGA